MTTINRMVIFAIPTLMIAACMSESQSSSLMPTATFVRQPPTQAASAASPTPIASPTSVPISPLPASTPTAIQPTITSPERSKNTQVKIKFNNRELTATLSDSKTTQDFLALLPLTLTLEDYARTEKIANLPRRLSTEGAPSGIDPSIGDITYYAPWGNLAIFYRDFNYSSGLILLGKIDSGVEALAAAGTLQVTIELAK